MCKSTPRSRHTTIPAPHRSVFYRPDALPAAQPTASKHWRQQRNTHIVIMAQQHFSFLLHLFWTSVFSPYEDRWRKSAVHAWTLTSTAHHQKDLTITVRSFAFSASTLLAGHQEEHPNCKSWVTRCCCGYLSAARCRLFAYGPADATAIPKHHNLLPHLNPDWFYRSGTGLPRLSWKRGHYTDVVVIVV